MREIVPAHLPTNKPRSFSSDAGRTWLRSAYRCPARVHARTLQSYARSSAVPRRAQRRAPRLEARVKRQASDLPLHECMALHAGAWDPPRGLIHGTFRTSRLPHVNVREQL